MQDGFCKIEVKPAAKAKTDRQSLDGRWYFINQSLFLRGGEIGA